MNPLDRRAFLRIDKGGGVLLLPAHLVVQDRGAEHAITESGKAADAERASTSRTSIHGFDPCHLQNVCFRVQDIKRLSIVYRALELSSAIVEGSSLRGGR